MRILHRILHVADVHRRPVFQHWVSKHASEFDLVCLAGDLLDAGQNIPIRDQVERTLDWLQTLPPRVCLCSGNHDIWSLEDGASDSDAGVGWLQRARRPGVMVDGDVEIFGTRRVVASGWLGPITIPTAEPTIVVTHAPPEGTRVSRNADDGYDLGDLDTFEIAQVLPRGSLMLSGHVHRPERWWARVGQTMCLNSGAQFNSDVPNHVVIDLKLGRATHFVGDQPSGLVHLDR